MGRDWCPTRHQPAGCTAAVRPSVGRQQMTVFVDGAQMPLIPPCTIPGCKTPVAEWGEVCDGCVAAFGDMLRPGRVPITEYEIRERDAYVRAEYAQQLRLSQRTGS